MIRILHQNIRQKLESHIEKNIIMNELISLSFFQSTEKGIIKQSIRDFRVVNGVDVTIRYKHKNK